MLTLWTTRLTTFLLWAIAAGGAVFWVLQTLQQTAVSPPSAPPAVMVAPLDTARVTSQVAKALGGGQEQPPEPSSVAVQQARFQLMGVLASGPKLGAALIAVDGKPAKPYPVGATVDEGLQVLALAPRSASLGRGDTVLFTLELPARK